MTRGIAIRLSICVLLFAALFHFAIPDDPKLRLCGFHWLTGKPCALCGLTRSLFALAKGHWAAALKLNALAPLGFAMLFALFWEGRFRARLWMAGIAAFAIYGVVRLF